MIEMRSSIAFFLLVLSFTACVLYCSAAQDNNESSNLIDSTPPLCVAALEAGTVTCSLLSSPGDLISNVPSWTQRLVITDSVLVPLEGRDLLPLTSLVSLTIRRSRVMLSPVLWPGVLPLQELVLDRCWSSSPNTSFPSAALGSRHQQYLQLQPLVWSQLSRLRTLQLVSCSTRVDDSVENESGFTVLPPTTFFSILGGEFECHASHVYLLDMVAAGRAAISPNTTCFILEDISKFNSFYTFNEKPLIDVLKLRKSVELCPPACRCELLGFRSLDRPLLSVDCRSAGLHTLPAVIPPLASSLIMSNNSLENIDEVFSNPSYSRLAKCDFSNNAISSIDGPALVRYFTSRGHDVKFDLRHNRLTRLPVWELQEFYSAAHRTGEKHLPAFDLSDNPWDCSDCSFSPYFKTFVYDNMFHIRDHVSVRCEGNGTRILHVDFEALCYPAQSPLMAIDVVNIFMALVLLATITNFAHNYYQYRRHGKLPWVVRHCKKC